jgi:hypothetical protein
MLEMDLLERAILPRWKPNMISMYSDAALPIRSHLSTRGRTLGLSREIFRRREERSSTGLAFEFGIDSNPGVRPPSGDHLHDEALDAVRGLALSVVLGFGCWIIIGVSIRAAFF